MAQEGEIEQEIKRSAKDSLMRIGCEQRLSRYAMFLASLSLPGCEVEYRVIAGASLHINDARDPVVFNQDVRWNEVAMIEDRRIAFIQMAMFGQDFQPCLYGTLRD